DYYCMIWHNNAYVF
nr:immunoglobulin light chain junction region [Macaca mulatta]